MRQPLLAYPVMQYAFVVDNLDEGMRHWTRTMGAGPFFVVRDFVGNELTYRGAPSSTRVSYAFGQSGPVQIQLISQDDPGPSIYRDMYAPGEGGLHHVCALVPLDEWDAQIKRFTQAGYECASTLTTTVPAVYFDCREDLGHFVELYGRTERTEGFFAMVAQTHVNWDGYTDPVRLRDGSPEVGV
jgi:methylmalonyl-CoA/ethylmalonyl-CoA epimerase